MTSTPEPVDFDTRPPMPVNEYEQMVQRVNVGYDLIFTLAESLLHSLRRPDLNLLVVGAGGGAEIERFLPRHPGWRLTGVDPSQEMLALAQTKAERLGLADRVTLVRGTVDDLPQGQRYDATTCMFVLHFLPDDAKVALLRGIAGRLHPDGPLVIAAGALGDMGGLEDEMRGTWQAYGERMGMPPERMAAIVEEITARPSTPEQEYSRFLRGAGFQHVACFFSALSALYGWVAR